jgi:tetratricopeptide (TPR) repeat protein
VDDGRGGRSGGRSSGRPATSAGRGGQSGGSGSSRSGGAGARSGGTGGRSGQPAGSWQDRRSGGGRPSDRRPGRSEVDPARRSEDQQRYDGPPIPEDITGRELDKGVAQSLRGLPEKLAARVARHLVAAGRVIDDDPETAYQHTLAARARAARVAIVREATGEAAYAAGHFAEALAELRAARRMTGSVDHLPVMADCERALGRPERALRLAKDPAVEKLTPELKVEMQIVAAGARADMGDVDGAVRALSTAPIRSISRDAWVVRLRYAYADLLLKAGRREEALEWFHRTEAVDGDQLTDAAARVAELEAQGVGTPPS